MPLVCPCYRPWVNKNLGLCSATRGQTPVELGGEHRSAMKSQELTLKGLGSLLFYSRGYSGLGRGGIWYKPSSPQHRRSHSCRNRLPWVPWAHSTAGWNHRTSNHDNNRQLQFPASGVLRVQEEAQTTPHRTAFVGTPVSEAQGLPGLGLPTYRKRTWQVCTVLPVARNGGKPGTQGTQGCQPPVTDPSGYLSPPFVMGEAGREIQFPSSELPTYSPEFLSSKHLKDKQVVRDRQVDSFGHESC